MSKTIRKVSSTLAILAVCVLFLAICFSWGQGVPFGQALVTMTATMAVVVLVATVLYMMVGLLDSLDKGGKNE